MYDASADPYCYPGTTILKNNPGFQDQAADLAKLQPEPFLEAMVLSFRGDEEPLVLALDAMIGCK
jgi:hypothetical protein